MATGVITSMAACGVAAAPADGVGRTSEAIKIGAPTPTPIVPAPTPIVPETPSLIPPAGCVHAPPSPVVGPAPTASTIHDGDPLRFPAPISSPETALDTFATRANAALMAGACRRAADGHRGIDTGIGEGFSSNALAMIAYDGACPDDALPTDQAVANRRALANQALASLQTNGELLGTTIEKGDNGDDNGRAGDLDSAFKDLLPLMFPPLRDQLTCEAYTNVLSILSAATGPHSNSIYQVHIRGIDVYTTTQFLLDPIDSLLQVAGLSNLSLLQSADADESENHIFLIESSRYLTNQLFKDQDPTNASYDNSKDGFHDWMLWQLQSVLKHDFQEFNAKPYQRYTLTAVQNLADFAAEDDVRLAARMVLDFSSAKFAVSSSHLRRNSPFRRRIEEDDHWYLGPNSDEQACRFLLYSGMTDVLAVSTDGLQQRLAFGCDKISRQAISSYRVPALILDLAMNKKTPYLQTFAGGTNDFHNAPGGLEVYDNEGTFMIASGGVPVGSGLQLHVHTVWPAPDFDIGTTSDGDVGLTVPTVLLSNDPFAMTNDREALVRLDTLAGDSGPDVYRQHHHPNICVTRGFACGTTPIIPDWLCAIGECNVPKTLWSFVPIPGATGPVGYVAVARYTPTLNVGEPIGFFEAVPATMFATLDAFKTAVMNENGDGTQLFAESQDFPGDPTGTPNTTTHVHYTRMDGTKVSFDYHMAGTSSANALLHPFVDDFRRYPVVTSDTASQLDANTDNWGLASGPVQSSGHNGLITVTSSTYGTCTLDFSNLASGPQRSGCDYRVPPPVTPSIFGWVSMQVNPATANVFPSDAYVASSDNVNGLQHACRAAYGGGVHVGHAKNGGCQFGYGGVGVTSNTFDLLTYDATYGAALVPQWVSEQNGALPASDSSGSGKGPVAGGHEADGTVQYVCRGDFGQYNLDEAAGKTVGDGCNVEYNGAELHLTAYQVLSVVDAPAGVDAGAGGGGGGAGGTGGTAGGGGKPCGGKVCEM